MRSLTAVRLLAVFVGALVGRACYDRWPEATVAMACGLLAMLWAQDLWDRSE